MFEVYKNKNILNSVLNSYFLNLPCYTSNNNKPVKMFIAINQFIVTNTTFCSNNTETSLKVDPKETTIASKKTETTNELTSIKDEFFDFYVFGCVLFVYL